MAKKNQTPKWNSSSTKVSREGNFAKELAKHNAGRLKTPPAQDDLEYARQRAFAKSKEKHSKYVDAEGEPDIQKMRKDLNEQMSEFRKTKV